MSGNEMSFTFVGKLEPEEISKNYVIEHNCDNCIHDKMCKFRDVIDELEEIADKFEEVDFNDITLNGQIECGMFEMEGEENDTKK